VSGVDDFIERVDIRDRVAVGQAALAAFDYAQAADCLGDAVRDDPRNPHLRYSLALALLGGARPRVHRSEWIKEIGVHLRHAAELPRARVLSALVAEDHGLHWLPSEALPERLAALIAQVSPVQAEEIVVHVPAPESGVWRAVRTRCER
jgi:hypothetical protein